VKVHAGIAYISGHGPFDGPNVLVQGIVGLDLTLEEGYGAAQLVALSILASLKQELGDLDRITQWIRAVGYIYSEPGFGHNAAVLNGFSDLIVELWGDAGRHARSAPGQGPSPFNVPVIVDAIAAVE
jgi:enamine deaminase RidA (YjgF/YER057c/UK114 family)